MVISNSKKTFTHQSWTSHVLDGWTTQYAIISKMITSEARQRHKHNQQVECVRLDT